jgi:ribosome assembly protein 1
MSRVQPKELSEMNSNTEKIRNICILAHVDHGKTTLSDSLVCSNGVISSKLAGKLRYLDSTEEEQRRGITMHSSAISLIFDLEKNSSNESTNSKSLDRYLINLVDSPGHLDFSSDVSTATRLCDGALIVIDVLEGICTQTHAVMFKALKERMRPCLILNKIDRLTLDMKLTSVEAFYHLRRLLEKANALAFTLVNSEIRLFEETKLKKSNSQFIEELDSNKLLEDWTLAPEKGNVLFSSALDCWGFGIGKFTTYWANKLGVNRNVLQKYFFDDYSYNTIDKKLVKCDPSNTHNNTKPIFAAMVLDPIWQIYDAAIVHHDPQRAANIASKVSLSFIVCYNSNLLSSLLLSLYLRICLRSVLIFFHEKYILAILVQL